MPVTKWNCGCAPGAAFAVATAAASVALSGAMTRDDAHSASSRVTPSIPNEEGLSGLPQRKPNSPVVESGYSVTNTLLTLGGIAPNSVLKLAGNAAMALDTTGSSAVQSGNGDMHVVTMPANPMSLPPTLMVNASMGLVGSELSCVPTVAVVAPLQASDVNE